MRIRKVSQTTPTQAQVVDGYSTSEVDSYSCNYVNNTFEIKGKIIWTNSDPTSDFNPQTITLDESLDNYDMYEILFLQSTTTSRMMTSGRIPVGNGTILDFITVYPKFRPTNATVSGNTITFEDCKSLNAIGSHVVENSSLIPMYVIAYNTGIFE